MQYFHSANSNSLQLIENVDCCNFPLIPTRAHKLFRKTTYVLSSIKILDFTSLLPGPFATKMLTELGAEVLRIDHPMKDDMIKSYGPRVGNTSTLFVALNHRKNILKLDLNQNEAKERIIELLSDYDVIIEGFRPGVMDRFSLSYEKLKQIRPDLIYCSISGYGQTSARRERAGHDINYLALSGISSYSGRKESGPPHLGLQMADLSGSFYAVQSILAAIIHRMKTGEGTRIDVSMRDAVLSLGIFKNNEYLNSGIIAEPQDGLLNGGSIYDYYKTSDARYLSIGALEAKFVQRLLYTLGIDTSTPGLSLLDETVKSQIKDIIIKKPLTHWIKIFDEVDCCVEPVLSLNDVFSDGEIKDLVNKVDVNSHSVQYLGNPIRFSNS